MAFKFKFRWMELGIGFLLSVGIIAGLPIMERELNRNVDIANFFNVRQLYVAPITPLGTLPVVVFDRTVSQDFDAKWSIDLQSISGDDFNTICNPKGTRKYVKGEELFGQGESILWFTVKYPECGIIKDKAGKYRIVVTWDIDRGRSYYDYKLEKISNVFEIVDPDMFIQSKTQEAINKTVKEVEAKVEALEEVPSLSTTSASETPNE